MERAQETHSKSGLGQGSVQEEGSVVSVWHGQGDWGCGRMPEPHLQHGYQCSRHTAHLSSHEGPHSPLKEQKLEPTYVLAWSSDSKYSYKQDCYWNWCGRDWTDWSASSWFPIPPLHNKQRTGVCAPTTLVHNQTIITFPIKESCYQLNSRSLWPFLGNKNWKLTTCFL